MPIELHDDRCATRKGYPCNCAMAVFLPESRRVRETEQPSIDGRVAPRLSTPPTDPQPED